MGLAETGDGRNGTGFNYRGADKSLARATSRCILFDGENISFDASLVIYVLYILRSKIEKSSLSGKKTTARCGIKETATTRNFVLWLFLINHDAG